MHETIRNHIGRVRVLADTAGQTVFFIAVWWVCDAAAKAAGLPVPGGVIGMLALLALLATGRLPAARLALGARGLRNHMLLFFVPAVITLRDHAELLSPLGLKLLAVIVVGIVSVMIGTALIVECSIRLRSHHVR
ncbi:MAG: CidA/LrgA family protein [Acidobacteriota bacterium]